MKKLLLGFMCMFAIACAYAQKETKEYSSLKNEIKELHITLDRINSDVEVLTKNKEKAESRISVLESANNKLYLRIDSLQKEYDELAKNQETDKSELTTQIGKTNDKVEATDAVISSRTIWGAFGILGLLLAFAVTIWAFLKKFKSGSSSIDEIKKAQTTLENAQNVMQQKSIELDTKLLDLFDKQIKIINEGQQTKNAEPDHSLIIKLANEIAKIETNLSKMDKTVRGYKQLVQAKDKMINNVTAYGYEIISLIGQEYNDGMQFPARFVPDESLEEGRRIITGMVKMQVNYKGKMIQAAEIVVNQNI